MMVTDIVREDIVFKEQEWSTEHKEPEKQIDQYNKSRRRFLFYPWGVFCTAYARRNLWYGIGNFGEDYIYADTDSIKHINSASHSEFIKDYNELCEWKLKRMCDHYGLDYKKELLPKTIKGEIKPIGVWDHDAHYEKFKTLGAKRYMVYEDGKLNITVSGVNKTHCYIDKCYEGDLTDYQGNTYHYISPSAIYLEKASYSFDINQQYIDFLKGIFYTE